MLLPLTTVVSSYGLDESLFRTLNLAGTNPVLDVLMSLFSAIALPQVLPFLAVPVWWKGRRELAFDLLVVLGIVILATEALKFAVNRERPCDVLTGVNLLHPSACAAEFDPSFPSGHTSRIFAVAVLLATGFRWGVRIGAFSVAVVTGLSRICLGVHWPSDVLAGALLGIGVALAFVVVTRRMPRYQRFRKRVVDAVDRLVHPRREA